jgi:membrane protein
VPSPYSAKGAFVGETGTSRWPRLLVPASFFEKIRCGGRGARRKRRLGTARGCATLYVLRRLAAFLAPTGKFLLQTEIHAYAFAISANLLLSFFPFLVLMLSICQNLLHWPRAADVIYLALQDFLPSDPGVLDFVRRNLRAAVSAHGRIAVFSAILLLATSNGVFEPLEVALNRVWGIGSNRSFWRNQWVSFGLILVCGALAFISILFTTMNRELLDALAGPLPALARWASLAAFKAAALPVSVAILFLVYWLLPNGLIPWRSALTAAIVIGVVMEAAKYLYILVWPLLDFRRVYGPFFISVTVIVWGVAASLILLAGAEISARLQRERAGPAAAGQAFPQKQIPKNLF